MLPNTTFSQNDDMGKLCGKTRPAILIPNQNLTEKVPVYVIQRLKQSILQLVYISN